MNPNLRAWANLLDKAFRVPGTNVRFGLDPILGLIPGLGDLASPVFAALLMMEGARLGVPKIILARMAINALLDALVGAIPFVGVVGDVFLRANTRNLALLERYAVPGTPPEKRDYWFVWTILVVFVLVLIGVVAFALWFFLRVIAWLSGQPLV